MAPGSPQRRKARDHRRLHGLGALLGTSVKHQGKTRMDIQHGQRMTAPAIDQGK
jgi:hypothetical protein